MVRRSKRFVLTSFCVMSQGVRAQGIVRTYPAIVNPVLEMLMRHNINIVQMPCPELVFDSFCRRPCHKPKYDKPKNRAACCQVAQQVVDQMILLRDNGNEIVAIVGIDFSPSCAVDLLYGPRRERQSGSGIFIEELKTLLTKNGFKIPMLGIRLYEIDHTLQRLKKLLER